MSKVALITGITGQDGSYLAEFLLKKDYEVHGIVRRSSLINTHRIDHIYEKIKLHYGDLTDATNLIRVIKQVEPDEIYNLGAQSHVKVSFEMPEYTGEVDGLGTLRVLDAVRLLGILIHTNFIHTLTKPFNIKSKIRSTCLNKLFYGVLYTRSNNIVIRFILLQH